MDSLAISGIVFGCIFGGMLVGMILRAILHERHLNAESRDLVKLGMGLIGTMTALVLGLLIASAKGTFDTQRNGLAQLSANVIFLDRILVRYGHETREARAMLKASVADMLRQTWPEEYPESAPSEGKVQTEGRYEGFFENIQGLKPKNERQRTLQAQAIKTATDLASTRWLLFAQKGRSIPPPFLVVMVAWLTLILASFSLFAPPTPTVVITLLICTVAVTSAVFLILELDQSFDGLLKISSAPLQNALAQLERS
jgi:hypothetical protein